MTDISHSPPFYTALCPDPQARHRLSALARQIKSVLGEGFIAQHPANLHLSTGLFAIDALPAGLSAAYTGKAATAPLPKPLHSDAGSLYLDAFYRPETGELALALCLPCTAASEWKSASIGENRLPPHITLGKLALDETRNTPQLRSALKKAIREHEGEFAPLAAVLASAQAGYAQQGPFGFDAAYLAPADRQQLTVPRGPVLPGCGQAACR